MDASIVFVVGAVLTAIIFIFGIYKLYLNRIYKHQFKNASTSLILLLIFSFTNSKIKSTFSSKINVSS